MEITQLLRDDLHDVQQILDSDDPTLAELDRARIKLRRHAHGHNIIITMSNLGIAAEEASRRIAMLAGRLIGMTIAIIVLAAI